MHLSLLRLNHAHKLCILNNTMKYKIANQVHTKYFAIHVNFIQIMFIFIYQVLYVYFGSLNGSTPPVSLKVKNATIN